MKVVKWIVLAAFALPLMAVLAFGSLIGGIGGGAAAACGALGQSQTQAQGKAKVSVRPVAGHLTPVQVGQVALAAGFPARELVTSIAVAHAESGFDPKIVNSIGASGLWQILRSAHPDLFAKYNWSDPAGNAAMAFAVWKAAGDSWGPWETYTNGAYRAYEAEARAAVGAAIKAAPVPVAVAAGAPAPGAAACRAAATQLFVPRGGKAGAGGGPRRQIAVQWAIAHLGIPYSWGGGNDAGPTLGIAQGATIVGYDCSSFTKAAYAAASVKLPRTAGEQWSATTPVRPGQEQTGDLVFSEIPAGKTGSAAGHVMLVEFVTRGVMHLLQEPHTGLSADRTTMPEAGAVIGRVKV